MNITKALLICLAATVSTVFAETNHHVHTLKEGETLRQLATTYLGGAEYLPELLQYNHIQNPLSVRAGDDVLIPGAERKQALAAIATARTNLEAADGAAAPSYAADEFTRANALLERANTSRREAAYHRAEVAAFMAARLAKESHGLADFRAPVQQPGKLTAVSGKVSVVMPGGAVVVGLVGKDVPVGATVKTDAAARAEVTMADGSVVQVLSATEFQIIEYRLDRRNGQRRTRLGVAAGGVLGKIKKKKKGDSYQIKTKTTTVAIRGTELRVNNEDTTRIALLEGQTDVIAGAGDGVAVKLPENFGTLIKGAQPPAAPVELQPPPAVVRPPGAAHTSGAFPFPFTWKKVDHKRAGQYHLELANDALFNDVIFDGTTADAELAVSLKPGSYHWRMTTVDVDLLEGQATGGVITIGVDLATRLVSSQPPIIRDGLWIVGRGHVISPERSGGIDSTVKRIDYSLNNQAFREMESKVYFSSEGSKTIQFRGIGPDGAEGPLGTQVFSVDLTPPALDVKAGVNVGSIRATATATDATGVKQIDYSTDGEKFSKYTAPVTVDAGEGTLLYFRATDTVGNTSKVIEITRDGVKK